MTTNLFTIALGFLALGSAMNSGLFFVFSNFAMTSFAKLKPEAGMAAMQSINVNIINPGFMALFFGTALGSLAVSAVAVLNWTHPVSLWVLAGAGLYLFGCIVVTMGFNVPLNNALAAVDPALPASADTWKHYLTHWVPWNHVRTVATFLAAAAFVVAMVKLAAD